MSWAFWRNPTEEVPQPPPVVDADLPPPEMDLNDMLAEPPPIEENPAWMDLEAQADQATPAPRPYLDVDLQKLQRDRLEREAQGYFWARLKRGEVSIKDVPGTSAAGGAVGRVVELFFRPIRIAFGNVGVIVAGLVVIALAGMGTAAIMQFVNYIFSPLSGF